MRAHSNTIRSLVASTPPTDLSAAPPAPPPRPKRRRSPLGHAEAAPPAAPVTASVGQRGARRGVRGAISYGCGKVSDTRGLHKADTKTQRWRVITQILLSGRGRLILRCMVKPTENRPRGSRSPSGGRSGNAQPVGSARLPRGRLAGLVRRAGRRTSKCTYVRSLYLSID